MPICVYLELICSGWAASLHRMEQEQAQRWANAVAATLRAERGVADKSQAEIERLTGISRSSYRLYEEARRLPDAVQMARIVEAFGIDWLYFMGEVARRVEASRP